MNSSQIMRIIDANLNRLSEGLRVLEEITRMILDDAELSVRLKDLRHNLIRADFEFNSELLESRNSSEDVGAELEVSGEEKTKETGLILIANARRAQESLRVLEEFSKMPEISGKLNSNLYKNARFELYTLEQELTAKIRRKDKAGKIKGLYVIIDTEALKGRDPAAAAQQVLEAGVKIIQFRAKSGDKRTILKTASELQTLCREYGAVFIVNDHIDIALAIKADGVHIGQEDLPAAQARKILPIDTLLGISASTAAEAQIAESDGADYIGVGAIFPTSSKTDVTLTGTQRITEIRQSVKIPLAAIGGINKNNIGEVIKAGADSACVISAVLNAPDIKESALELIKIIEDTK